MNAKEMERLERVAKNMIHDRLRMEQVEGNHGIIYIAHGLNPEGKLVGIWGHRGIARDLEFKDDASLDDIRQILVDDAASHIADLVDGDLIDAGES